MKRTIFATFLISLLLGGMAFAAPIAQIVGGFTSLELSSEAVQALESMDITPSGIVPGKFNPQNAKSSFPIPAGAIDLGNSRGDIFHAGGLALDSSDTNVSLLNFIIDTTGQNPVLTGLVATNGTISNRISLFNLALPKSLQPDENGTIVITDVALTLTQEAADTLNDAFGTSAFEENLSFGNAVVVAQSFERGAQKPVREEPVVKGPADEEPVDEEPVDEEPVAEEPVDEEPVAEEPVDEEPVDEEPVAEEPVDEEPVDEEPVAEEPVDEEPVDEEPVAEEPVDEEPVDEEPVAEEPVDEEPVDEEPVAEEPVDEEPVDEEPVAEEPVDEEPVAEEPVAEEPVDEEPVIVAPVVG